MNNYTEILNTYRDFQQDGTKQDAAILTLCFVMLRQAQAMEGMVFGKEYPSGFEALAMAISGHPQRDFNLAEAIAGIEQAIRDKSDE